MGQEIFPDSVLRSVDDAVLNSRTPDHIKSALALTYRMCGVYTGTIDANLHFAAIDVKDEQSPAHPQQIHLWLADHGLSNRPSSRYSSTNQLKITPLGVAYIQSDYPFGSQEPREVGTTKNGKEWVVRQLLDIRSGVTCTAQVSATLDTDEALKIKKANAGLFEKLETALGKHFYGLSRNTSSIMPLVISPAFIDKIAGYVSAENTVSMTVPLTDDLLDYADRYHVSDSGKTGYTIDQINVHLPGQDKPLRGNGINIATLKLTKPNYVTLYVNNGLREAAMNGLQWEVQQTYRAKSKSIVDNISTKLGFPLLK